MTAQLVPPSLSRSACWAVPASHPPHWIEPQGSGSTEIVLSGPPRGSDLSRVHTLSAGSAHIRVSADKETCGPTQTLRAYNVTAHKHMCTWSQTNRRQMGKFTHMFGHNGCLFTLQLERDTDVSSSTFHTFPSTSDLYAYNWCKVTCSWHRISLSTQGGQWSHASASNLAVVPAVFRNLSYSNPFLEISTHDLSPLGAVSQRDRDKPHFSPFPPTISIKKRFEVEKHIFIQGMQQKILEKGENKYVVVSFEGIF